MQELQLCKHKKLYHTMSPHHGGSDQQWRKGSTWIRTALFEAGNMGLWWMYNVGGRAEARRSSSSMCHPDVGVVDTQRRTS